MANVTEFNCPCCGSSLKFDAANQNIKCPYCDSEFSIDDVKGSIEEHAQDFNDNANWDTKDAMEEMSNEESSLLNSYCCDMCGGEIIADENTASTSCPYCGNNVLIKSRLTGALKPKYIIPFKKTEEDAKVALKDYMKGKILLPRVFKDENRIKEIKPLYVPYWLYDADVNARIKYIGKTVRRWTSGDYEYKEEKYYSVVREGGIAYEHLPIDASKSIDNKYTESIEPYHFSEAKAFESAYLAGYMSDKYDVTAEEDSARATQRIKEGTEMAFRKTVNGYNEVKLDSCNIQLYNTKAEYALYPLYFLNTKWKENNYKFAMNGETGTLKGDLPMSKIKYFSWLFSLFIAFGALLTLLFYFLIDGEGIAIPLLVGILLGFLISFLITHGMKKQLKGIVFQRGSAAYYKDGSMHLTVATDRFMYKRVTRTRVSSSSSSRKR